MIAVATLFLLSSSAFAACGCLAHRFVTRFPSPPGTASPSLQRPAFASPPRKNPSFRMVRAFPDDNALPPSGPPARIQHPCSCYRRLSPTQLFPKS